MKLAIKWLDEHFEEITVVLLALICVKMAQNENVNAMTWPEDLKILLYLDRLFIAWIYNKKGNMSGLMDLFSVRMNWNFVNIIILAVMVFSGIQ